MTAPKSLDKWLFSHPARFVAIVVVLIIALLILLALAIVGVSAVPGTSPSGMVADTLAGLLALGTLSLAYATGFMSQSAKRQADVLEIQFSVERSRDEEARANAKRAEAILHAESFPRIRIVTTKSLGARDWTTVTPGNVYPQTFAPRLGIQNQGKGQAVDLRTTAAWRVFDFERAKTASPQELEAASWAPVPQRVPPVDLLDSLDVSAVESVLWTSGFAVGGHMTKRIIGLYVRVSWTDPDGVRQQSKGVGLVLIPGAVHTGGDVEYTDFLAIGPDEAPPEGTFSREAPL